MSIFISLCEVHREFIEAQMLLHRNAVGIYKDLVGAHGITAAYKSVKRSMRALLNKKPEQFDRWYFLPDKEMQVDNANLHSTSLNWLELGLFAWSDSLRHLITNYQEKALECFCQEITHTSQQGGLTHVRRRCN